MVGEERRGEKKETFVWFCMGCVSWFDVFGGLSFLFGYWGFANWGRGGQAGRLVWFGWDDLLGLDDGLGGRDIE